MKKVVTYIILTAFLFGTMEIALKIAGSTFDSIQLTFLRFLIGGLVLAPFGVAEIRKDNIKITKGDWLWLLLVGIMGIAISMAWHFQIGVQHCNASTAAADLLEPAVHHGYRPLLYLGEDGQSEGAGIFHRHRGSGIHDSSVGRSAGQHGVRYGHHASGIRYLCSIYG